MFIRPRQRLPSFLHVGAEAQRNEESGVALHGVSAEGTSVQGDEVALAGVLEGRGESVRQGEIGRAHV